jgi:hypothetical protein
VRVRSHVPLMFQLKFLRVTDGKTHLRFERPARQGSGVLPLRAEPKRRRSRRRQNLVVRLGVDKREHQAEPVEEREIRSGLGLGGCLGLSSGLPAWPSEQPVAEQLYVSYCAENCGELPAVPCDARSRKSLTPGTCQNGSSETRQTPTRGRTVPICCRNRTASCRRSGRCRRRCSGPCTPGVAPANAPSRLIVWDDELTDRFVARLLSVNTSLTTNCVPWPFCVRRPSCSYVPRVLNFALRLLVNCLCKLAPIPPFSDSSERSLIEPLPRFVFRSMALAVR